MNKILVVGATGMLGKPVVQELLKAEFKVSALVRNVEKAKSELPDQVQLIQGDLKDPGSLKKAFIDQEYVYLNLGSDPSEKEKDFHAESDGLKNILAAAKDVDIKRIGMISSMVQYYEDIIWWLFDIKKKAVSLIRESGLPHYIFYPSSFMESMFFKSRQGNKILLVGKSKYPVYWIAGNDYGIQVANAFKLNPSSNREYIIQGKKGYNIKEAADLFVNSYKKENLKVSNVSLGLIQFLGIFSSKMSYGANISRALNNYEEKFGAKETWNELGEPQITIEEFAASI